MNPYILSLEHKQASLEMVGGKGMSLSKLLTAGIPVPDGFHVTTASYRILLKRTRFSLTSKHCWRAQIPTVPANLKIYPSRLVNFFIMEKCRRKYRRQ